MKKVILFDLDGTVTNSLSLILRTNQKVFAKMDIPWQDQEVMKYIGIPLVDIGKIFAGVDRAAEYVSTYMGFYGLEHDKYMECYPGATDTIRLAKQAGYLTGVVTSKSRRGTMLSLEFLQLISDFDVIITADDVTEHKPKPAPVWAALKALDISPDQALFVGDSPFDILAGLAAGVRTIGVTWGMANGELLRACNPDFMVDNWDELNEILLNDTLFK